MAEGSCPQVFVVDTHASYAQPPIKQKPIWKRVSRKLLLPLLGLVTFGLVIEGIFIYTLYQKTEAFSLFLSSSLCQNQSSPQTIHGVIMSRLGPEVSNELPGPVHSDDFKKRPMAHLHGSDAITNDSVVQWVKNSDGFVNHMGYNHSGLLIKKRGYYYLYSNVHIQETSEEDCAVVTHRVFRNTTAYGLPIELMKSKSLHCRSKREVREKTEKNLSKSFLAGLFLLESGDLVFVKLDKGWYSEPADNFLGAFLIH